jgi:hypothetical protein
MRIKYYSLIALSFLTIIAISSFTSKNKISIEGAWSVTEVETIKADGSKTSTYPVESVVLFATKHYSFCWSSHVANPQSWQMSDPDKIARFNQSIINTGTFELKKDVLTTKAALAMNPKFVEGEAKFLCTMKGDTLFLKGLSVVSSDGVMHPVYASGSYFVSKLVRIGKK